MATVTVTTNNSLSNCQ